MNFRRLGSAVTLFLLFSGLASANSLGLTLLTWPDIGVGGIGVNYNAATHLLTANGFAFNYNAIYAINGSQPNTSGTFQLSASIDNQGVLHGGTVNIAGNIPGIGAPGAGPTLLAGDLFQFGFPNAGGDPFEFRFYHLTGTLASTYQQHQGGVSAIITMYGTDFPGNFQQDFSNTPFGGMADVGVPEPASAGLMLTAGVLFIGLYRFRRV